MEATIEVAGISATLLYFLVYFAMIGSGVLAKVIKDFIFKDKPSIVKSLSAGIDAGNAFAFLTLMVLAAAHLA